MNVFIQKGFSWVQFVCIVLQLNQKLSFGSEQW